MRALGDVRELDVELAAPHSPGSPEPEPWLAPLLSLLEARRVAARRRALRVLDSRRYARLVERVGMLVARLTGRRGSPPIALHAAPLIGRRRRRVLTLARRLTPSSAPADFHRVRIRGKHLRYALEFTAGLYGDDGARVLERLVRLQDVLGEHQDAEVALARLQEIVDREGRRLPPRTLVALGMIAERHALRAAALRAELPATVDRLRGKRWRRLERRIIAEATAAVTVAGAR
jgi:CHAD domain-containing protein